MAFDLAFHAPRMITDDGEVAGCVGVRDGRVVAVAPWGTPMQAERVVRLGPDEVLLPGIVDAHVHVNEPGRTEWEGFDTATRAAAAGGVTTVVDMPLNSIPPTVNVSALQTKRAAADGAVSVDVGFWGGAVPGNVADLRGLHDAGVFGFKCFLAPSGVEEFGHLDYEQLGRALEAIAGFGGLLIVHAEDAATLEQAPPADGRRYADFLASRPAAAEEVAIARVIELARRTGARVHIVHLSSSDALPMIASARRDGVALTVETCPHYLSLAAEQIPDGATPFKCCPPIREVANRDLLWEGLRDGTIDCVVSDHSPCAPELKRRDIGDFGSAWGGVASLQLGLRVVWTRARRRGLGLGEVVRWMATGPAAVTGLERKGRIAVGYDADLVVFAPEERSVVDAAALRHRHPVTPYAGHTLHGVVRGTWLRGARVDTVDDGPPRGRLLRRDEA